MPKNSPTTVERPTPTITAVAGTAMGIEVRLRTSTATLQAIAAENNLSETAFFVPRGARYQLRWMTPTMEVDLCGHATLASAHILWTEGRVPPDRSIKLSHRRAKGPDEALQETAKGGPRPSRRMSR